VVEASSLRRAGPEEEGLLEEKEEAMSEPEQEAAVDPQATVVGPPAGLPATVDHHIYQMKEDLVTRVGWVGGSDSLQDVAIVAAALYIARQAASTDTKYHLAVFNPTNKMVGWFGRLGQ
jgi:hypothetical protein